MDWMALAKLIFSSIIGVSKAVEVRTKPEEIQVGEFKEKIKLREQDLNQEMINDDYRYLKRRTEFDVPKTRAYLKRVHPDMEDIDGYMEIVNARVYQFRYDNAKNFFLPKVMKWVKDNPKP